MTIEQIELLKRIKGYLEPSTMVNAVYIPPAQALRNAAEELERKEKDLLDFGVLIESLSSDLIK